MEKKRKAEEKRTRRKDRKAVASSLPLDTPDEEVQDDVETPVEDSTSADN